MTAQLALAEVVASATGGTCCCRCGKSVTALRARGLCGCCYQWAWKRGRLEEFPARPPRRTVRAAIPDSAGGRPHSRAKYVHERCGCEVCLAANLAYNRRRERAQAYGRPTMVDADPARRHVRMLQGKGLGTRRIAELAGVDRKAVTVLLHGRGDRGTPPPAKIHRETAGKLLSVQFTLDALARHAAVSSVGGVWQLRELIATGWSQAELAERLGVAERNFSQLLGESRWYAATLRAVVALYEDLRNKRPPVAPFGALDAGMRADG